MVASTCASSAWDSGVSSAPVLKYSTKLRGLLGWALSNAGWSWPRRASPACNVGDNCVLDRMAETDA